MRKRGRDKAEIIIHALQRSNGIQRLPCPDLVPKAEQDGVYAKPPGLLGASRLPIIPSASQ
jgi:hypothetical protein